MPSKAPADLSGHRQAWQHLVQGGQKGGGSSARLGALGTIVLLVQRASSMLFWVFK